MDFDYTPKVKEFEQCTQRFANGPNEMHRNSIAKLEIARHLPARSN